MESSIRTEHLTKHYGKVYALNNVSISLKKGEIYGFLGLNGAGIYLRSHILGEISRLATRIGIIHQGSLIQEIDTNELENLCKKRLVLDTDNKKAARLKLLKNGYSVDISKEELLEVKGEDGVRN